MKNLYRKARMKIVRNLKLKVYDLEDVETCLVLTNKSDEFLATLITMRAYLDIVLHKYGY